MTYLAYSGLGYCSSLVERRQIDMDTFLFRQKKILRSQGSWIVPTTLRLLRNSYLKSKEGKGAHYFMILC